MGSPYSSTVVSGYNSNPPSDDGSATEANRGKWSTIKTKLGDPLNTFASAVNSAIVTAFGKMIGGAGVTSTAVNYTVQSSDQGKLVRASAGSITITTPDATSVTSPFVFGVLNDSTADITLDGSGSQTIDGDASITIPPNCGVMCETDGTNWFTFGQNFQRTQIVPQGYLTLVSGTPVIASDQAAATAVYYTPFVGNLVPIPNGTLFSIRELAELTLTLASQHVASTIYDAFIFEDPSSAGTFRLGTGPAWSNSSSLTGARGTGAGTTELTRLKGLYVNNVAITARNGASTYSVGAKCGLYVGSLFMDGTNGQISCHVTAGTSRKWGVWNAYNRQKISLKMNDSTASWTYASATVRQARGTAANKVTVFCGLAEEIASVLCRQTVGLFISGAQTDEASIGVGWGATNAYVSGSKVGNSYFTQSGANSFEPRNDLVAEYDALPFIGIVDVSPNESTPNASGTITFYGGTLMQMIARWLG